MAPEQILFIGLSNVGDVVMGTPVLRALHGLYPAAVFDVVADNKSRDLYECAPFIRAIYIKHKDGLLRGAPALIRTLWRTRYDLIVDIRTDGLAWLLRGRRKYTKWRRKSYGEHAVLELLGVIAGLHGDRPVPHTKVWLADQHREAARRQLARFKGGRLLALGVGSALKPLKSWPEEKFIELCRLRRADFAGVILLGNEAERARTQRVIRGLDLPCIDTLGNSLLAAAALLERAFVYLGPDSGLGHIASAMGRPTVTFFGPLNPARYRPWGEKAQFAVGQGQDARNIPVAELNALIGNCLRRDWIKTRRAAVP